MLWRRKPASYVEYLNGSVNRSAGFNTVIVYCIATPGGRPCGHSGHLLLANFPDWSWEDISAHLKCTKCGAIRYVDTRVNWSEKVNFSKGVC